MQRTIKRILALGLIVGASGFVWFCYNRARSSGPQPHIAVYGTLKSTEDRWLRPHLTSIASLSISNAGTEDVWLETGRLQRLGFGPHSPFMGQTVFALQRGQVTTLGNCKILNGQFSLQISARTRGSKAQQLYHALAPALIALWITWDPVHARNVFNAAMKSNFFGPTHKISRTVTVKPPEEYGEEIPILIDLAPQQEAKK